MGQRIGVPAVVLMLIAASLPAQEEKGIRTVPREQVRQERAKRWAVLIGVDKYEDEAGIGSLKYCGRDMKLLYQVLTGPNGGYDTRNVLLMTQDAPEPGHRPTYSNMVAMIPRWIEDAKPEDDVLIAFSGHGVEEGGEAYLLPSTARFGRLRLTGVSLALLREWMDACQAARKVLIVDACHAGAGKNAPAMAEGFQRELDRGEGFVKLASCGPKQKSNEDAALKSPVGEGHGVFTYHLAAALEGKADFDKDGRVDVDEAYRYAYEETARWARSKGLRQDPMKSGAVTGVMTIGYQRSLEDLKRERREAEAKLAKLTDDSARPGSDAAKRAIEDARRAEAERLRELERKLAELQGGVSGDDALKQYQVARAQYDQLQAELGRQRQHYTDTSSVVRSLLEKIETARSEMERRRQEALAPGMEKLRALQRQRAEMAREMLPTHPKMREIDAQIENAATELAGLVDAPQGMSVKHIVGALTAGVPPALNLDLGGGVTMKLVYIPPGEFMMGSPDNEKDRRNDEGPQHRVRITKGFYMGVTEVTQAQYEAVMGNNPSHFKGRDNPVEMVSWNDAAQFCERASRKTGRTVRLPTEAEWEYACRAGSSTRFCFGDADGGLGEYAWYSSNSGGATKPVGQKKPNAWGLYDAHGNVWEWCADWYAEDYYAKSPSTDPTGPVTGQSRVLRGGSWYNSPRSTRAACRD